MRLLVLSLITLISLSATAEVVQGLHEVRVPVETRSVSELRRAAATGLETVLIRVSGERRLDDNAIVRQALRRADTFLSQYQYVMSEADPEPQLNLQMQFLSGQIERLLQQAGLPTWSPNRPRVLVWLVSDDLQGRRFVTRESHPELVAGLEKQALQRGLLLSFPLLDLQDTSSLSPEQMWSLDMLGIELATERYNASHALVGRLSQLSSGAWVGNLVYRSDLGNQYWDVRGATAEVVTLQPVDNIADQLAARYAVLTTAGGAQSLNLMIKGIQGFPDYARAASYLEGIAIIDHANLIWLYDSQLVINVIAKGSLQKIEEFFALDGKLVVAEAEPLIQPARPAMSEETESSPEEGGDRTPVDSQREDNSSFMSRLMSGNDEAPDQAMTAMEISPPEPVAPVLNIHGYYRWQGSR